MFMGGGENILVGSRDGVFDFVRGGCGEGKNVLNGNIYVESEFGSYDDLEIGILSFYEVVFSCGGGFGYFGRSVVMGYFVNRVVGGFYVGEFV